MATNVKAKNGTASAEAMAEVAAKATADAKAAVDTVLDTVAKVNENSLAMLNAQQKMMKDGFEVWEKYNKVYFDFILDATQKSFNQSLAFRKELGKLTETNLKTAQELFTEEQKLTLEAAEAMQAQMQVASERVTEMLTPVFEK